MAVDPAILEYGSPTVRQRQIIEALIEHGSQRKAAEAIGCHKKGVANALNAVARRAALAGYAPGHFTSGVAPGFGMGKVTVQRNADGDVERTWERQSPDRVAQFEIIREAIADLAGDLRGLLPPIASPSTVDCDLLTVIPMGDPHFGMMAWAKESGENFDLAIAEDVTTRAVDRLCALSPASETAMLLNLGDFYHADNSSNRTPRSGANLDVDGRFQKIAQVGFRAMVRCIRRMLEKHQRVIVRNNNGNHDPHQAFMLSLALDAMFHDEPRVEVDMSPSSFFYHRFGKVLIGSTHGDGAKLDALPLIMAHDMPDDWAASKFRVFHCGHFHHDQLKDHPGCTVETHQTLASTDAWHRHQGYRSQRGMKAIVYHREFGEVNRIRCGVEQLEKAA